MAGRDFFGSIGGTFYRTALASRTAGFGSPPMDHFQQAMVSNAKANMVAA